MKRLTLLLLALSTIFLANAQITHTSKGQVDQNAEKYLKKAYDKINGGGVSFSVTMVSKDSNKKETARHKADVLFNKGKYRVTFGTNVIYCDGAATWHWDKEVNEVVVNKASTAEDDLMNPAAILANYKKNFNAKFIRKEQNGNAVIDLTPKKSKSYYKIRLIVNAESGIMNKMEVHNYDSSSADYIVSSFKSGVKTSDTDFKFTKSANDGVEIIDMR